MCKAGTGEISIFWLVSVAEETGLKLAFVRNPEDRFSRNEALLYLYFLWAST